MTCKPGSVPPKGG